MNRSPTRTGAEQPEGLAERLLAAALAVPIFELSLYLGFFVAGGARRSLHYFFALPVWFHAAFVGLAVAVGLWSGFKGITWLLGHLFLTHGEQDRDERLTVIIWAGILALAMVGYLAAH